MDRDYNKLILNKLDDYTNNYRAYLRLCNLSFSEKNIHKLRVSIRRLLSLLAFVNAYLPNPYVNRLVKLFKKKMKILNPVRDTQVMILRVNAFEKKYPELQDFYFYLFKRENQLTKDIKNALIKDDISEIDGNLLWLKLFIKDKLQKNKISNEMFLFEYNRIKELFESRYQELTIRNDETIHYLRLAFKKLRYFLEVIYDIFPENALEIKKLRKFQNTMGAIQDIAVILEQISLFKDISSYTLNRDFLNFISDLSADSQFLKNKLIKQLHNFKLPNLEKTLKKIEFF